MDPSGAKQMVHPSRDFVGTTIFVWHEIRDLFVRLFSPLSLSLLFLFSSSVSLSRGYNDSIRGPSRSIPICGLRLMVQASVRVAPRASALSCAYLFVAFVTAGPFKRFSIVVSGGENRRPAGRPRLSFSLVLRWGRGGERVKERERVLRKMPDARKKQD